MRRLGVAILAAFVNMGAGTGFSLEPDQPMGISGRFDPPRKSFTLSWEPVRQNSNGDATDMAGYNIYRRTTPRGAAEKINAYVVPIVVYADRVDGRTFYYTIRAVDTDGRESAESLMVESSDEASVLFIAPDGRSAVTLPQSINGVMKPAGNRYGAALGIRMTGDEADAGASRSVKLEFFRGDTKQATPDIECEPIDIDVSIAYDAPKEAVALFRLDGARWTRLSGTIDAARQVVTAKTARLGHFQTRAEPPSPALTLAKVNVYPPLFTPNGDGFNDRVYLVLENTDNAVLDGHIYDLRGRRVATLGVPSANANVDTTFAWDGRSMDGSVVPGGLYVYRVDGGGQTFTGILSVAR